MKPRLFPCVMVLCALAFVAVALLPRILQRHDPAYAFQGVHIMPADAEIHYMARIREVYDGFDTGNTFYSEPKDQPYLQPPYPEAVPALVARLLRVDPVTAFTAFNGLCAFALFLIMVGTLSSLTACRWEALIAVCGLVFAGFLLGAPWDVGMFLAGAGFYEPLRFARPINPLWTVPWFFAAIWLVAIWMHKRDLRLMAACCVPLIVLVYSYVYAWSYLAVVFGLLTLRFASQRDWMRTRDLLLCGFVVGVASIPYASHLLVTMGHPLYGQSALRLGLHVSHMPVVGAWAIIGLAIVSFSRKYWKSTWLLVAALIIGGVLAMNQHMVTGKFIVPHHYHWYFFHPLASLLTMTFALQLVGRILSYRYRPLLAGVLLVTAMLFGFRYQELAYVSVRAYWGEQQKLAPVLKYLNEHLGVGQVVYSQDVDVMDLVPIYTSADVYTSSNANNYLVATKRARDVFFFNIWVRGYDADRAERGFPTVLRSALGSALYAIYFREKFGSYEAVPDKVVNENILAYKAYLALPDLEKIQMYPISAVVMPDDTEETPAIKQLNALSTETFKAEGFTVRMMKSDL